MFGKTRLMSAVLNAINQSARNRNQKLGCGGNPEIRSHRPRKTKVKLIDWWIASLNIFACCPIDFEIENPLARRNLVRPVISKWSRRPERTEKKTLCWEEKFVSELTRFKSSPSRKNRGKSPVRVKWKNWQKISVKKRFSLTIFAENKIQPSALTHNFSSILFNTRCQLIYLIEFLRF